MADDLKLLNDLIKDEACAKIERNYGKNTVTLKESGNEKKYVLKINNVPNNIIAINVDKNFEAPTKIFKNNKGECKRADFVLVASNDTVAWIIYIEMKRSNSNQDNQIIRQQLKGARCFMAYCKSIGREFWSQPQFLEEYEERFVSIVNIGVNKKPTRNIMGNSDLHNLPDQMLKISTRGDKLQFKYLIDRPS